MSGSSGTADIPTATATERTLLLPVRSAEDGCDLTNPRGLRKVADSFPLSVWLIATIELCERFAYFGIVGPMQNYIQSTVALSQGGTGRSAVFEPLLPQLSNYHT